MSRRRLFRMLLRRELNGGFLLALLGTAAAAVLAGHGAGDLRASGMATGPLRLLLRFDLMALAVAALIAALRVCGRAAEDHAAAWLDPYCAAGGSRAAYGLAVAAAAATAAILLFLTGAAAFSATVWRVDGTPELVQRLPVLAAGGSLIIIAVSCYFTAFALIMREPLASAFLACTLAAAPYLFVFVHFSREPGAPLPRPLLLWLRSYPPQVVPPATPRGFLLTLAYIAAAATAITLISARTAGRRT